MKEKFINSKWHFTMVENSVIEDERLLPSEKLVYVVLSKFASQERSCFPSLSTISKLSGYSKSTVVRAINRLCYLGYLTKERRKDEVRGNISTFYTLTLPEEAPPVSSPEDPSYQTLPPEEILSEDPPRRNCLLITLPLVPMTQALVSPCNKPCLLVTLPCVTSEP